MSNFGSDKQGLPVLNELPTITEPVEPQVAEEPRVLKIVDWEEALAMAGNDLEFLRELVSDLLNEARAAEEEIGEAIRNSNYTVIMRAAHRIGGTCSYFCCEETLDICQKLKTTGHDGMQGLQSTQALRAEFDMLYIKFVECLNTLRARIAARFAE